MEGENRKEEKVEEMKKIRMKNCVERLMNFYWFNTIEFLPEVLVFVEGVNRKTFERVDRFIRKKFNRIGLYDYNSWRCMMSEGFLTVPVDEDRFPESVFLFVRGFWNLKAKVDDLGKILQGADEIIKESKNALEEKKVNKRNRKEEKLRRFRMKDCIEELMHFYWVNTTEYLPEIIVFIEGINRETFEEVSEFVKGEFSKMGLHEYDRQKYMGGGFSVVPVDEDRFTDSIFLFARGFWNLKAKVDDLRSVLLEAEWKIQVAKCILEGSNYV
jgi:hypothetical protein